MVRSVSFLSFLALLSVSTVVVWSQQNTVSPPDKARAGAQGSTPPSLTVEDYVESLPAAQREGYCEKAFSGKNYVDHPACWSTVKNANSVLGGVLALGEPLSTHRLAALDRVFPQLFSEEDRKQAGLLLYRYKRGAGERYLAGRLEDRQDTAAAQTFAVNHEAKYLPFILKAMRERQAPEVVQALGRWKSPTVSKELLEAFKIALRKKEGDANFPIPLSQQNNRDAIPLILKLDESLTFEDGPAKYDTRAALIKLGAPGSEKFSKEFITSLTNEKTELSRIDVIRALGATERPAAIRALMGQIKVFNEKGSTPIWVNDGKVHADESAVEAAEALARIHHVAALDLVSLQLLRFKKDKRSLVDYWERTADAMVLLGGGKLGSSSEKTLVNVMGKKWLKTAVSTRELKWIPAQWIPMGVWDPAMGAT